MLDMIFYTNNARPSKYVELSEEIYEWLAKSQFSKIGCSIEKSFLIDGEEECLPVVELDRENRQQLRLFFLEAVAEESEAVLSQLQSASSKETYQQITYRLQKLQELRKCIENENYLYLQRI
ncbi:MULTISPECIES: hypothetical protein [Spirulina sp. CCY15215]|uniref:hypothetical protein n=1 Tax=Spirulina sp. CCY15215 TaxID=2767591 RepID=UPI001951681A|nr:hypothetical protein [Spirulina major]